MDSKGSSGARCSFAGLRYRFPWKQNVERQVSTPINKALPELKEKVSIPPYENGSCGMDSKDQPSRTATIAPNDSEEPLVCVHGVEPNNNNTAFDGLPPPPMPPDFPCAIAEDDILAVKIASPTHLCPSPSYSVIDQCALKIVSARKENDDSQSDGFQTSNVSDSSRVVEKSSSLPENKTCAQRTVVRSHQQLYAFDISQLRDDESPSQIHVLRLGWNKIHCLSLETLGYFSHLRVLDLRYNRITTAGIDLIFRATSEHLEELYVPHNAIQWLFSPDSRPSDFLNCSMRRLRILDIAYNQIKELPNTAYEDLFPLLTIFDASYNLLETLPSGIGNLQHLETLNIMGNLCFQSIPSTVGRLQCLQALALDWFRFWNPFLSDFVRDEHILTQCRSTLNQAAAQGLEALDCWEWCDKMNSIKGATVDGSHQVLDRNYMAVAATGSKASTTLLHKAAREGHLGVIKSFLQHGASFEVVDRDGLTPLFVALQSSAGDKIVRLLASTGTSLTSGPLGSALHVTVAKVNASLSRYLLESCHADPNVTDDDGNTPLHVLMSVFDVNPIAAREIAQLFVDHGAYCNLCNRDKWSPIHLAARRGQIAAIRFIVEQQLQAPLACRIGICDHAKDPTSHRKDLSKATAFPSKTCPTVFDFDLRGGSHAWSALHLAGHANQSQIVNILMKGGANVMLRNRTGLTPRQVSRGAVITSKLLKLGEDAWLRHKTLIFRNSFLKHIEAQSSMLQVEPVPSDLLPDEMFCKTLGIGVVPAIAVGDASSHSFSSPIQFTHGQCTENVVTPFESPTKIASSTTPNASNIYDLSDSLAARINRNKRSKTRPFDFGSTSCVDGATDDPLSNLPEFRVVSTTSTSHHEANVNEFAFDELHTFDALQHWTFGATEWESVQRQLCITGFLFHPNAAKQLETLKPLKLTSHVSRVATALEYLCVASNPRVRHQVPDSQLMATPDTPLLQTALHIALTYTMENLVLLILGSQKGSWHITRFRTTEQQTALHLLCQSEWGSPVDLVLRLLQLPGATWDVNAQDCHGFTPLHCAAKAGHADVIQLLMVNGADPNVAEHTTAWTPLHLAVAHGRHDAVMMLLAHPDIDVDKEDNFCRAPLAEAVAHLDFRVMSLLVNRGATLPLPVSLQQRILGVIGCPSLPSISDTSEALRAVKIGMDNALSRIRHDTAHHDDVVNLLNANGITTECKQSVDLSDIIVHLNSQDAVSSPQQRIQLRRPLGMVSLATTRLRRPQRRRWKKPIRTFCFPLTTTLGRHCYMCEQPPVNTNNRKRSTGVCRVCSVPLCDDCSTLISTYETSFLEYKETRFARPVAELAAAVPVRATPRVILAHCPSPLNPQTPVSISSKPGVRSTASFSDSTPSTRTPLSDKTVFFEGVHQPLKNTLPFTDPPRSSEDTAVQQDWVHSVVDFHHAMQQLKKCRKPRQGMLPLKYEQSVAANCAPVAKTLLDKLTGTSSNHSSHYSGINLKDWFLLFRSFPPFTLVSVKTARPTPKSLVPPTASRSCVDPPVDLATELLSFPSCELQDVIVCPKCLANFKYASPTDIKSVGLHGHVR